MFTRLVQGVGSVAESRRGAQGDRLVIEPGDWPAAGLAPGESISVSGVCLTLAAPVDERGGAAMTFDVVPETLSKTTLGRLGVGSRVNLERSLAAGDLLGGHFVQGHVDGVGTVEHVDAEWRVRVRPPAELMAFMTPKGSVCVEGVSLTIASVDRDAFEVALIPTTLAKTTLGALKAGAEVNIETDILARTVVHYLKTRGE